MFTSDPLTAICGKEGMPEPTGGHEETNYGTAKTPQMQRMIAEGEFNATIIKAERSKHFRKNPMAPVFVGMSKIPQRLICDSHFIDPESDGEVDDQDDPTYVIPEREPYDVEPPTNEEEPVLHYCVVNGGATLCSHCTNCRPNPKVAEPI